MQGEEASTSLLGEPQNLLTLGDKMGGQQIGIYSYHSQLHRIRASLGQRGTRDTDCEGRPRIPRLTPQPSD